MVVAAMPFILTRLDGLAKQIQQCNEFLYSFACDQQQIREVFFRQYNTQQYMYSMYPPPYFPIAVLLQIIAEAHASRSY